MKINSISKLRCPKTRSKLKVVEGFKQNKGDITEGILKNKKGFEYKITNGIPDFTTENDLVGNAAFARDYYAEIATTYDENVDITFKLYNEDESLIRNKMIDLLELKPENKVLEISAGTGKDSEIIANRLNEKGELFCIDISPEMLKYAKDKLKDIAIPVELICGTAVSLPFETNCFDSLFCFAGVGHFLDIKAALAEMARVVKPGGKVVFAEKNVPLWLRDTLYGRILINNNPMFANETPLKYIPVEARDLGIRWINGNVHYVIDYTVGDGDPKGNFDLELPGERGGTFNTRYYGKLEGVTAETKKKAIEAQKLTGKSMHKWMDEIIRKEAEKILNKEE